jgi:hypothetical protein
MNRLLIQRLCIGALTLLVATGCSGDDDSSGDAGDGPSLEDAVRAYSADFLAGDATAAYARMSERCHGVLEEQVFAGVVAQSAELFGDEEITKYDDDIDGDKATATYTFSDPTINQTDEPWVLENGAWHTDHC